MNEHVPWVNPDSSICALGRRTAVHEAGHVTIMWHHLGFVPHVARIWTYDGGWEGEVVPCPGVRISAHKRRLIAVAGTVAEAVWDGAADASEVLVRYMSQEDWEWFGPLHDLRDGRALLSAIRTCFKLLNYDGPLWPNLAFETRRLIAKAQR
jgi:hypothetical protein